MICQSPHLSATIQSLKRHTSKSITEELKKDQKDWMLNLFQYYKKSHKKESQYQVWQEGFHPKQILSDDMFRQKSEYIHYNPVRRGLVIRPECWVYSSAADLAGLRRGPVELAPLPL